MPASTSPSLLVTPPITISNASDYFKNEPGVKGELLWAPASTSPPLLVTPPITITSGLNTTNSSWKKCVRKALNSQIASTQPTKLFKCSSKRIRSNFLIFHRFSFSRLAEGRRSTVEGKPDDPFPFRHPPSTSPQALSIPVPLKK